MVYTEMSSIQLFRRQPCERFPQFKKAFSSFEAVLMSRS